MRYYIKSDVQATYFDRAKPDFRRAVKLLSEPMDEILDF